MRSSHRAAKQRSRQQQELLGVADRTHVASHASRCWALAVQWLWLCCWTSAMAMFARTVRVEGRAAMRVKRVFVLCPPSLLSPRWTHSSWRKRMTAPTKT